MSLEKINLSTKKHSTANFASLMVESHKFKKKFKLSLCQSKRFCSISTSSAMNGHLLLTKNH
jgi:hypothetical protein